MRTEKISHQQIAMLTACYVTSGAIVSTAKEMVGTAQQDAWFGFYLPMLYAFLVIGILQWLFRQNQKHSLFTLTKALLGKTGGSVANALLFVYVLHILALDLRELSEFTKTILLQRTPLLVIMFCILLLTVYLVSSGVEVLARLGHFYFFFLSFSVILLPLLLLNELDIANLLPVFARGLDPVLRSSIMPIAPFGEILVFGALFLYFSEDVEKPPIHPLIRGVLFSAFLLTLLAITLIATAGTSISGKAMYPSLTLVQMIRITDFLDRLDILMVSLWIPAFVIKISVTYYIMCQCLGCIGPQNRDGKAFALVVMPLVLLLALLSFESIVELTHFEWHTWPIITVIFHSALFLVLAASRWIRGRREVEA